MISRLIQSRASNNSAVNKESLTRYLNKSYQILESLLTQVHRDSNDYDGPKPGAANNKKHISTTNPDASVMRMDRGKSKYKYQVHRGADDKCEILTATEVNPDSVNKAHRFKLILRCHHQNTGSKPQTCVADSKYETTEN